MNQILMKSTFAKLAPDPQLDCRIEQALRDRPEQKMMAQQSRRLKPAFAIGLAVLLVLSASLLFGRLMHRPSGQTQVTSSASVTHAGTTAGTTAGATTGTPAETTGASLMPLSFNSKQDLIAAIGKNDEHESYRLGDIVYLQQPVNLPQQALLKSIDVRSVYIAWQYELADPQDPAGAAKQKDITRWEAEHLYSFVQDRSEDSPAALQTWLEIMPGFVQYEADGFSGYYNEYDSPTMSGVAVQRRMVIWLADDDCLYIEMPASIPLDDIPQLCQTERVSID
ncbi:MAG: hypothetical protein SCM11_09780 [Bacillota bacterium]|nr:hypothetical protein [Bacillota bacterium]